MHRPLLFLNLLLVVCLGVLWSLDSSLEKSRESYRAADSAFHALAGPETPKPDSVISLDLLPPGSATKWKYVRRTDGWRIPHYRDAFALGQPIEGLLKSLLESHGTVVGRLPEQAEHFGFVSGKTLEVELYNASATLLVRAIAGNVAPGQRAEECYVAAHGRDAILHLGSNPRSYVEWAPDSRLPPLIDMKIIPTALSRGLPARVVFGGEKAPAVRELIRREVPKDQRQAFGPDRGPRFEWFGTMAEGEKRMNDNVAFAYTGFLSGLEWNDILGGREGREGLFDRPSLTVTLEYDGGAKDTLTLGARDAQGLHALLHSATGQVFLVAADKVQGLTPDVKALLELPPAPPAQPPTPPVPPAAFPPVPEAK